jgi:predicted nucleic acid-binding protein
LVSRKPSFITSSRRILVDTSAWLALINRDERRPAAAVQFQRSLGKGVSRVTSWGIVGETYTWLRYHRGNRSSERWLRQEADLEERAVLEVVYPAAQTESGVRRTLSRFADQDLSYVDAISLHIVQTRGDIDAIFAFDHHLSLYGTPVLPDNA